MAELRCAANHDVCHGTRADLLLASGQSRSVALFVEDFGRKGRLSESERRCSAIVLLRASSFYFRNENISPGGLSSLSGSSASAAISGSARA